MCGGKRGGEVVELRLVFFFKDLIKNKQILVFLKSTVLVSI